MSRGPFRLPRDASGATGRLIAREEPLRFTFDGRRLAGYAGDTLASALLGAGVAVAGRSARLHRARGINGGVPGAPDPLVTVDGRPNLAPGEVALAAGLRAASQGGWPTARFDAGAWAGRRRSALPPGAAYKTRPWPHPLWDGAGRLMRRAMARAGRDTSFAEALPPLVQGIDVLVIGGGVAGLAAAEAATAAGLRVVLVERAPRLGGIADGYDGTVEGLPIANWIAGRAGALAAGGLAEIVTGATVAALSPGRALVLERPAERLRLVAARAVVLATGAAERPLVFPDNHRPGVMLAGAARLLLRRHAVAPGRRVVVAAASDEGYRTALDLHAAGIAVERVIDLRLEAESAMAYIARSQGLRMALGSAPVAVAAGPRGAAAAVTVMNRLAAEEVALTETIACDAVLVSGGWSPNLALAAGAGAALAFDPALGGLCIAEAPPGLLAAGAANGRFNLAAAVEDGWRAGAAAADHVRPGSTTAARPRPDTTVSEDPRPDAIALLPDVPTPAQRTRAVVDPAGDVSVQDIAVALAEGYAAPRQLARYAGLGRGLSDAATASLTAAVVAALGGPPPAAPEGAEARLAAPIALGTLAAAREELGRS